MRLSLAILAALLSAPPSVPPAPPPAVLRFSPRPNRAHEIHWRAFGPAAFAEARASGKPLFLNLAAVWCHWCHVFDETTLSDPEVIASLNERFIPMRVDADQNPEVERRYLLGGWPSNAFLADDGEVLGGGTYYPPAQWKALAAAVLEGYGGDRAALKAHLGGTYPPPHDDTAPGSLDPAMVPRIGAEIAGAIDPQWGGFGTAPKFPQGPALSFLAYLGATRQIADAASKARASLLRMRAGEIFDGVEGGFFRYAMKEDWSSPHYEKMLQGNAEILQALADTAVSTGEDALGSSAQSIAGYLSTHLWDERSGGFYGSQDADEEYYKRDAAGRSALRPPPIDKTFLADRMAIAARAFLRAAVVFEDPSLASYAQRSMDLVLARMRAPDGTVFHALSSDPGAVAHLSGQLDDQAEVSLALIDLAAWTGEDRYLRASEEIVAAARRALGDEQPGYFDVPLAEGAAGLTRIRIKPFDGNVSLAWALLRLGEVLGDEGLQREGVRTLEAFAGRARGLGAAAFGQAADLALRGGLRLVVVGPVKSRQTQALFEAARSLTDPRREVRLLDSSRAAPTLGDLSFPAGPPAVYVCRKGSCSPPVRDAAGVAAAAAAALQEINRSVP
jgi:uncharacterized protein YyaL (SSP411 family)